MISFDFIVIDLSRVMRALDPVIECMTALFQIHFHQLQLFFVGIQGFLVSDLMLEEICYLSSDGIELVQVLLENKMHLGIPRCVLR